MKDEFSIQYCLLNRQFVFVSLLDKVTDPLPAAVVFVLRKTERIRIHRRSGGSKRRNSIGFD